ncbi:MAG: L-2-amino-thiazoline-4-carboxylic acid hydrolase [Candidatus Thorarchaeota archaeon]
MNEQFNTISMQEAKRAVEGLVSRLALLHIAFSKTIVQELSEERGKDLVAKAIIDYGQRIAKRVQSSLPDLPSFGVYDDSGQDEEGRYFARGCNLAKVFQEQDASDVGYLYCYMDAAKSMAESPETKLIHLTCEACGDENCTFDILPTTEEERKAFSNQTGIWRKVDSRLYKYQ